MNATEKILHALGSYAYGMDLTVSFEKLPKCIGGTNGVYSREIRINTAMSQEDQCVILAHEIGHAATYETIGQNATEVDRYCFESLLSRDYSVFSPDDLLQILDSGEHLANAFAVIILFDVGCSDSFIKRAIKILNRCRFGQLLLAAKHLKAKGETRYSRALRAKEN